MVPAWYRHFSPIAEPLKSNLATLTDGPDIVNLFVLNQIGTRSLLSLGQYKNSLLLVPTTMHQSVS